MKFVKKKLLCYQIFRHFLLIFVGHSVRLYGQKKQDGKKAGGASLALPKIRKNPLIEIIAINTGYVNKSEKFWSRNHHPLMLITEYCKRGNFRVGVIFMFFALLSFSRKLPPRENETHMPL